MSQQSIEAEMMALLKVPEKFEINKRVHMMQSRLAGLGFGMECPRCCGSGDTPSMVADSICYQCSGVCKVFRKITKALYEQVQEAVAAGKLEAYLTELRRAHEVAKLCRTSYERVMAAWEGSGIGKLYNWTLITSGIQPHRELSEKINEPMCAAYTKVFNAAVEIEGLNHKLANECSKEKVLALKAEIKEKSEALVAMTEESIEVVNQTAQLIPGIMIQYAAVSV